MKFALVQENKLLSKIKKIRHLRSYLQGQLNRHKFLVAGLYFSLFQKVFRKNGITIHIPFHLTDYKFRGRFVLDSYEVEEAKYLTKYLSPNAKVLELGACLGYISCLTNQLLKDKTQHVVLEANPELIKWVEKNRTENQCLFAIENTIISNNKVNTFYIHDLIVGGSTKRKTSKAFEVKGITINELQEKYQIEFDTLIIDIEGGELELLRSHQDSLTSINQIFIELHPFANILTIPEAEECEAILKSIGFSLVLRDNHFQIWEKLSRSKP